MIREENLIKRKKSDVILCLLKGLCFFAFKRKMIIDLMNLEITIKSLFLLHILSYYIYKVQHFEKCIFIFRFHGSVFIH